MFGREIQCLHRTQGVFFSHIEGELHKKFYFSPIKGFGFDLFRRTAIKISYFNYIIIIVVVVII